MSKLSQQVIKREQPTRPLRTERVLGQREFEVQRRKAQAGKRLESANYETYESVYNSIDPRYRRDYISPAELKQTEGYKGYAEKKQQGEKINYLLDKASKMDRGKPFTMYGESRDDIRLVNEYREGIGTGSIKERRARFLQQRYPNLDKEEISKVVGRGTQEFFGFSPAVRGLEPGEKVTITTRATSDPTPKSVEVYERTIPAKRLPSQLTYTKTTYQQVDKQALDEAYKDVTEGVYFLDSTPSKQKLPYQQRGTISDQPTTDYLPTTFEKEQKTQSKGFFSTIKKYWGYIPIGEVTAYDEEGKPVTLRESREKYIDYASEKQELLLLSEIERTGVKEKADIKFQKEYELKFYRSDVGKKAFYGEVDFEEAQVEFGESEQAKIIGKKYQQDIELARAGSPITKEGLAIAGWGLVKTGVSLIPTTRKGAIVGGVLLYTGVTVLKAVPPVITGIGTGAIGTSGLITVFSPTASPEEKAGGLFTAGLSFGVLGIQGLRYLRRPTITTEGIAIRQTLDTQLQRGFVRKLSRKSIIDVTGKKTMIDYYKANKLTEQLVYGRKSIVSTKWRDLLRLDPIYKGVPYQQRGTTFAIEGLRGVGIYTTESAYTRAFNLLVKRGGLTKAQARANLRYYQPKQILSKYEADIVVKYGDAYKQPIIDIKGTRIITQPATMVDEALGIKTRGATTIKEFITGKGSIIGDVKGRTLYGTAFEIEKAYLTEGGAVYQKLSQAGKTTKQFQQLTSVGEKGDGFLRLELKKTGYAVSRDYPFQVFDEKSLAKQVIPRGSWRFGETESAVFKRSVPTVEIDLRKLYGISVKEEIIRKQKVVSNIDKLHDPAYMKQVLKSLRNIYGGKAVKTLGITSPPITPKTTGAVVNQIKTATQIKTTFNPVQAIKNQIKNILKIGQESKTFTKMGMGSVSVGAILTKQKSAFTSAGDQELLKDLMKGKQTLKTSQALISGQAQSLSQAQQLKMDKALSGMLEFKIPSIKRPLYDVPPPPTPPTIPIFFPGAERRRPRTKKSRAIQELLYLPDFTSRAIGLKAQTISEKEAKKRLKQILTGLEIRRPVKVKF